MLLVRSSVDGVIAGASVGRGRSAVPKPIAGRVVADSPEGSPPVVIGGAATGRFGATLLEPGEADLGVSPLSPTVRSRLVAASGPCGDVWSLNVRWASVVRDGVDVSRGLLRFRATVAGFVAGSFATGVVGSPFGEPTSRSFNTYHAPTPTNTTATTIASFVSRRMIDPSTAGGWGGDLRVPVGDRPGRDRHMLIRKISGCAARSNPENVEPKSIYRKTVSGQRKTV